MSLAVIGAALPRTGTLSLKFALEMLGIGRCYHMTEFIIDPAPRWRWALAGMRPALLDPLWDRFSSTVDAPGCTMWRQLAARFPHAKVILTRRDPQVWFDSVEQTVGAKDHADVLMRSPIALAMLARNPFGLRMERAAMIARFEAYGAAVRSAIAPERLLEFNPADGWEPLCAFLGKPVPPTPFPRVNEREAMQAASQSLKPGDKPAFAEIQRQVSDYLETQRQRLLA